MQGGTFISIKKRVSFRKPYELPPPLVDGSSKFQFYLLPAHVLVFSRALDRIVFILFQIFLLLRIAITNLLSVVLVDIAAGV